MEESWLSRFPVIVLFAKVIADVVSEGMFFVAAMAWYTAVAAENKPTGTDSSLPAFWASLISFMLIMFVGLYKLLRVNQKQRFYLQVHEHMRQMMSSSGGLVLSPMEEPFEIAAFTKTMLLVGDAAAYVCMTMLDQAARAAMDCEGSVRCMWLYVLSGSVLVVVLAALGMLALQWAARHTAKGITPDRTERFAVLGEFGMDNAAWWLAMGFRAALVTTLDSAYLPSGTDERTIRWILASSVFVLSILILLLLGWLLHTPSGDSETFTKNYQPLSSIKRFADSAEWYGNILQKWAAGRAVVHMLHVFTDFLRKTLAYLSAVMLKDAFQAQFTPVGSASHVHFTYSAIATVCAIAIGAVLQGLRDSLAKILAQARSEEASSIVASGRPVIQAALRLCDGPTAASGIGSINTASSCDSARQPRTVLKSASLAASAAASAASLSVGIAARGVQQSWQAVTGRMSRADLLSVRYDVLAETSSLYSKGMALVVGLAWNNYLVEALGKSVTSHYWLYALACTAVATFIAAALSRWTSHIFAAEAAQASDGMSGPSDATCSLVPGDDNGTVEPSADTELIHAVWRWHLESNQQLELSKRELELENAALKAQVESYRRLEVATDHSDSNGLREALLARRTPELPVPPA